MTLLNVGVLGLSHDHVWPNLAALNAGTLGRLVAVAEPDPLLRERLHGLYAGAALHATFDDLLERRDIWIEDGGSPVNRRIDHAMISMRVVAGMGCAGLVTKRSAFVAACHAVFPLHTPFSTRRAGTAVGFRQSRLVASASLVLKQTNQM